MASNYWLKLYHEMLDDPKVARLPDSSYRRFIECLLLAGELDEGGYLPSIQDMAWRVRVSESSLSDDMTRLALAGVVELKEDGRWFVTKFQERQAPISSTERSRRSRAAAQNNHGARDTWRTEIYEPLPAESGIYRLWIDESGKSYIGSSKNIQQRIKQHLSEIRADYHKMNNDFVKYGTGSIHAEVLELCPVESLPEKETKWIKTYDTASLYNAETIGKDHRQRQYDALATNRPTDTDTDTDTDKIQIADKATAAAFTAYGDNIGGLTPIISDELGELIDTHTAKTVIEAITEAAKYNGRNIKYITTILDRWAKEGKGSKKQKTTIYPEIKSFMTGSKHYKDLSPAAQSFVKAHGGNDLKRISPNSFEDNQIKREAEAYAQ